MSPRFAQSICFMTVADAGSFTAAAERLGCSKAQASKLVSALERALGVQLLMRTTRTLALTEAGRAYLEHCRRLREALADGERAVSAVSREISGTLAVTAPPSFGEAFLRELLMAFQARHPQLRIALDLSIEHQDLLSKAFDFAFRATRMPDESLVSRTLALGSDVVVASPAFLQTCGELRTPADLAGVECLLSAHPRNTTEWVFMRSGDAIVVDVNGRFVVNHFGVLRDAAIAGAGVAKLPAYLAADAIARGALVRLLPDYETEPTPLCLVYPQRRFMPHRNRAFRDFVYEWFADPARVRVFG